jgi:hypothetical protein
MVLFFSPIFVSTSGSLMVRTFASVRSLCRPILAGDGGVMRGFLVYEFANSVHQKSSNDLD